MSGKKGDEEMSEEEKKAIELGIEAKYVGKTKKEFLNNITYAECLYILTPENEYGNKIIELSLQKLREITEKLQKENEKQSQLIEKIKQYLFDKDMMCDFLESEE